MASEPNKTAPTDADVDAFLASVEHPVRRRDALRLVELMTRVTGEQPRLWGPSIVGFGNCRYKYPDGREMDWMLIAFSPRKQNLVVYLRSGFAEDTELLDKLGKHKTGKSCLYINSLDDVHVPTLKTLIKKSAAYMRDKE